MPPDYGMTECAIISLTPDSEDPLQAGHVPVTGVEVQIRDPVTGEALGPNQRGEILNKGKMVII